MSIALRVDHYDVCLEAKVGQAHEIFSAKIGSLASNLYARIATPDLNEKNSKEEVQLYKEAFFEELGFSQVAWLSPVQKKALKSRVKKAVQESNGAPIAKEEAVALLEDLPNETIEAAERVIQVLSRRNMLVDSEADTLSTVKSYLVNDLSFKKLTRK